MAKNFYGLVIAGGAGTRLWPVSRALRPKQLQALGNSDQSLLQETFGRLSRNLPAENIRVVTSQAYADQVHAQLVALAPDYLIANVLAEPIGRDSAAAVLWGALRIHAEAPDAVMAVVWSDQRIRREQAFDEALQLGYGAVQDGGMVAIGVRPSRPATNLGYIRYGRAVQDGVFEVERFVEKPNLPAAKRLIGEGACVWNAGIFVFKVRTLLEEFERHAPSMVGYFREHEDGPATGNWSDPELMQAIYNRLPKESFDYLILEKTDHLRIIPADLEWSDLGTWDEIYYQHDKDENGNAVNGNAVTLDTRNTFIRGGKRLIATVGVEDLVVVDTDDALLIVSMSHVQDIKRLVEILGGRERSLVEGFEQTARPWGSYAVLAEGEGFKVKVLDVNPHQKLSLQMHHQRDEHWVVVLGQAVLTCENQVRNCGPNEHFYIPKGSRHRIENQSDSPVRIVEVQHGAYLGEDDIVRFQDAYGRA